MTAAGGRTGPPGLVLLAALLMLTGCGSVTGVGVTGADDFPALLPIGELLAQGEALAGDPGPAQAERAARLRARAAAPAP